MCGLLNNDISDDLEFSSVVFFAYCQFFSDAIGYTRDLCSVAEFLANISCDIVFTRHFARFAHLSTKSIFSHFL